MRDGLVYFEQAEDDVQAFDDVLFPLALGREAEVSPGFSTAIATSAGGHEARTASWAEARTSYDVGPGVRSESDIADLLAFFRARMGPTRGFRLRDPFDPVGVNEAIGTGDGVATRFALVRQYGESSRRITRPVAGSVGVGGERSELPSVAPTPSPSLAGRGEANTTPSSRALTRAREALGVPFRLHGRDLRGMDCVGLAAWAWDESAPTGYALRASPSERIGCELAALGFVRGAGPGAIVLVAPGSGQLHLGISAGAGIIHADAVARRVVERAAPLPWPILAGWIRED